MTDLVVVRKGGIGNAVAEAIAAQKNVANGIAPLDADSKVLAANVRFGTEAGTIAQGNDTRLRTIWDEGTALTNRAILDFIGTGVTVEDDSVAGRTKVTISGVAAGAASGAVSVKDHGAVGDGITNDSPAFQAAIDAVFGDGGGSVLVPRGRYRLAGSITVKSNVHLLGVAESVNEAVFNPDASWISTAVPFAALRSSVLLIDHGAGTSIAPGSNATTETNPLPAIKLEGNSPALKGFTIEYPGQLTPVRVWFASTAKVVGRRIQPTSPSNVGLFECSVAGTTGTAEPTWPTTDGQTVVDGGVTWTRIGAQNKSPIAYPPTIGLGTKNTLRVQVPSVREVLITNAYDAICFDIPHNRAIIEHCRIGAYRTAIRIDGAYGVTRINHVHVFPYYLTSRGLPYAEYGQNGRVALSDWVEGPVAAGNGDGLVFGKADWAEVHDFFAFSRARGIVLTDYGQGPSSGKLFGVGLDAMNRAIWTDACQSRGWDIYGLHYYLYNLSVRLGITTEGAGPNFPVLRIVGGAAEGSNASRHVNHTQGSLTMTGLQMGLTQFGTVRYGVSAAYMRLHGCRWVAGSQAAIGFDGSAQGKVILAENDTGSCAWASPSPAITNYRAGGNLGTNPIPSSGW